MTTRKRLGAIKGISEAKVDKIKEMVAKVNGVSCSLTNIFTTTKNLLQKMRSLKKFKYFIHHK